MINNAPPLKRTWIGIRKAIDNNILFTKQHWIAFIPVIILNIVALRQIYLKNVDYLDAWKGGGFGMFSQISLRYYHIHLINKGTFECAESHPNLRGTLKEIIKHPNYLPLEKLGKKLIKSIWVYNYTNPTEQAPYSVIMLGPHDKLTAIDKITKFKSIEIQIFNAKFNKEKFTLEPQLLRKVTAIK